MFSANVNLDFGKRKDRVLLTLDKNFTFGHYKVGVGNATVAGAKVGDNLYYGITFCSPLDNFSKKVGRITAMKNLIENKHSHLRGVLKIDDSDNKIPPAIVLKYAVSYHIEKMNGRKPQWLKKGTEVDFRREKKIL